MKKSLLLLLLFITSFALKLTAHEEIIQQANPDQYLRKIQKLKNTHKLPNIVITSVVNNTEHDLLIIDESTYEQYLLESGYEYDRNDIPFLTHKNQQRIPLNERLQGTCSQFNFFIAQPDEFGAISTKNCGFCTLNLLVNLHDKTDDNEHQISTMFASLTTEYFARKAHSDSIVKITNFELKECCVVLTINNITKLYDPNNSEFKFLCTIS
ncbi:MAG: hypothetical protein Q8Q60_00145 [Candidatus Chromulinivorax sp.]|nr:hypothetical protein [Candidatus Chromulinivorax sp.]